MLESSKVIRKGSPADLKQQSQEGHSGGPWLPKTRLAQDFHQGDGVCFGCSSQIMGLWLVPSGWGRWELKGFPQTVGTRYLANSRASHCEVVGTVLSSLPSLPKRKTSALAFLCLEASALV